MASDKGVSYDLYPFEGTDTGSIYQYKRQIARWGLGKNVSRRDWMKIALLLRDQEAAGKTGPARIQVGNRKLAGEDYYRFLEHYGVSETDFLETAIAFGDGASGEAWDSMAHVLVTDVPVAERQCASDFCL